MAMYGYGGGMYGYNPAGYGYGAVPGFTAPAYGMPMAQMGQMPPPYQMPVSGQCMAMNNMFWNTDPSTVNMALAAGCIDAEDELDEYDEEEEEEEEEEEDDDDFDEDSKEERRKMKAQAKKSKRAAKKIAQKAQEDEDFLERIRGLYIDNLCDNLRKTGTLDPCAGTVMEFTTYTEDDGVAKWFATRESPMTIAGESWDPEYDCEYFHKAMEGAGTDEQAMIHVVATRNNAQRQKMKKMYKTMYGEDIIDNIKGDLSGDFEEAILACFVSPAEYDAWCIKEAIYGPGTDETALIEILMTRTNEQIQAMREVYSSVVSTSRCEETALDEDLDGDLSGDFQRLCISAAQGNRNMLEREQVEEAVEPVLTYDDKPSGQFKVNMEKLVNMDKAKRDAQQLYEAGEDSIGTDEETFNRIFSVKEPNHTRCVYEEYVKLCQRDILNSIDRETSGDFEKGLYAIVMNNRCRPMYFAERLRDTMKGLGTKDRDLIRVVVSRAETDMVQIKKCFLELTKKTLWKWLQEDTSGDYRELLSMLVGKN